MNHSYIKVSIHWSIISCLLKLCPIHCLYQISQCNPTKQPLQFFPPFSGVGSEDIFLAQSKYWRCCHEGGELGVGLREGRIWEGSSSGLDPPKQPFPLCHLETSCNPGISPGASWRLAILACTVRLLDETVAFWDFVLFSTGCGFMCD